MALELDKFDQISQFLDSHRRRIIDCDSVALLKNVLSHDVCEKIKNEMINWKRTESSLDETQAQLSSSLNFHTDLSNTDTPSDHSGLNFIVGKTNIVAHNYRIGNFTDDELKKIAPTLCSQGSFLLDVFHTLVGKKGFAKKSETKKQFYLEIVHFPSGAGHVELHSHETMANNGLVLSVLFLLSQKGEDYTSGGVVFVRDDSELDLTDTFCKGDLVVFNNNLPHYVSKIEGLVSEKGGRWVMGFYYY